jgi:hypothetical protein
LARSTQGRSSRGDCQTKIYASQISDPVQLAVRGADRAMDISSSAITPLAASSRMYFSVVAHDDVLEPTYAERSSPRTWKANTVSPTAKRSALISMTRTTSHSEFMEWPTSMRIDAAAHIA